MMKNFHFLITNNFPWEISSHYFFGTWTLLTEKFENLFSTGHFCSAAFSQSTLNFKAPVPLILFYSILLYLHSFHFFQLIRYKNSVSLLRSLPIYKFITKSVFTWCIQIIVFINLSTIHSRIHRHLHFHQRARNFPLFMSFIYSVAPHFQFSVVPFSFSVSAKRSAFSTIRKNIPEQIHWKTGCSALLTVLHFTSFLTFFSFSLNPLFYFFSDEF